MRQRPLVSIIVPNYNHSRYLDECITSALNQTYDNIEVIILDNASEDDSVAIAMKYLGDKVRVCRNCYNILNATYKVLITLAEGKYIMMLCADDAIESTFVEKAVSIMEKYPEVGYVHGERDFINESGELMELDPFFKCSFIAPGKAVMPIYMVTTIAHPSQGIFRAEVFKNIGGYDMEVDHMNADRMLWYYLSEVSDYAYIREKMCRIRIGNQTETFITQRNFQHPILCHLTIKEMVRYARQKSIENIIVREKEAYERLAKDFMNYVVGMLLVEDYECAGRYLDYIKILSDDVAESDEYIYLVGLQSKKEAIDRSKLDKFAVGAYQKKRGYEPPDGYIELNLEEV